jgi:oligopeptide transport system substrate-binding protein
MLDVTRRHAPLALAAILAATRIAEAQGRIVLHRGNDGDPETLDPHRTSTVAEAHLLRDLSEGLVIHNMRGEVVPGVAESWTMSPDGRVWRFNLRANAKWSNGEPFKAADFVYSFRRILNPETGAKYANLLFPIRNAEAIHKASPGSSLDDLGVKALDEHTLEMTLERPTPYLLELLTHQSALPVHPSSASKTSLEPGRSGSWVTNGAYILSEFAP